MTKMELREATRPKSGREKYVCNYGDMCSFERVILAENNKPRERERGNKKRDDSRRSLVTSHVSSQSEIVSPCVVVDFFPPSRLASKRQLMIFHPIIPLFTPTSSCRSQQSLISVDLYLILLSVKWPNSRREHVQGNVPRPTPPI